MQSSGAPPPLFCAIGSEDTSISDEVLKEKIFEFLGTVGPKEDILLLPPDYTRYHSQAGKITQIIDEYYYKHAQQERPKSFQIMPALGTHAPMSDEQLNGMFGRDLASRPDTFLVHDWRNDVVTIGHAPAEMVKEATYGMVEGEPWPAQLNKVVWEKRNAETALVLSIGQVVPHEVMGMANFNKNLFVGVGGVKAINLSHFIGAVHGMERMMGRANNPLRSILNYASEQFLQNQLNLWYVLTVMGRNDATGDLEMKGLFIGNTIDCYNLACELSLRVNFTLLPKAPTKVVTYLDPEEFHSTWLGNKAIYRTRMAIADGGTLIVLAPGVGRFGEDDQVDELIRKYGYKGTPATMEAMKTHEELQQNLSAVAHLIHGSSEGRFDVVYCPGHLTRKEVEGVGFRYADLGEMSAKYDVNKLADGWNKEEDGTEFFFISNPALGLWAVADRFEEKSTPGVAEPAQLSTKHQQAVGGSGGVGGWAKPPA